MPAHAYPSHQIYRTAEASVWSATGPVVAGGPSVYVALFRLTGSGNVVVALADLGLKGAWSVTDVWSGTALPYVDCYVWRFLSSGSHPPPAPPIPIAIP